MARTRYIDYRAEDATELWNEQGRGIIPAGVYAGFTISQGSAGGLSLQFTHDIDPDNALAGGLIGKLVTKDGVAIYEDAHQDNVCVGSVAAGTPNIHYVVASYIYNKGLPNNDVQYMVKQGTAGGIPVPPTLTDDEIKLGEIYVPAGAIDYSTSDIRSVAKLKTTDLTDHLFGDYTAGLLDPGIYDGMNPSVGTAPLEITLSAGEWLTNENIKITEAVDQVDVLTLSGCAAGTYYLAWIVGMHKREETDPIPSVDYMLVEGAAQAVGTAATLPNNATILATAVATSYKYDDAVYINKLGIVRVENRAATYHIDYIKGTSVIDADTLTVHAGTSNSSYRSGHYYGYTGLQSAISDVYTLSQSREDLQKPYTIKLDGEFRSYDDILHLPSNVKLVGLGAPASIKGENSYPVACEGLSKTYDSVNPMFSAVATGGVSGGFTQKTFTLGVAYQTGYTLTALQLSAGDKVILQSAAFGIYDVGTVISVLGNWQFQAWIPTQYNTDGDPTDCDVLIFKRNIHLEDLEVTSINAGNGNLSVKYVENSRLHNVIVRRLDVAGLYKANWGYIEVQNAVTGWTGLTSISDWCGQYSRFDHIKLLDEVGSATVSLGVSSLNTEIGTLEYDNPANAVVVQPRWPGLTCGLLSVRGDVGSRIELHYDNQCYQRVYTNRTIQTGAGSQISVINASADVVEMQGAGAYISFGHVAATTVTNTSIDPSNKILKHTVAASQNEQFLEHANEDRNLKFVSDAVISWDLSTGRLTWNDIIAVDVPWNTGYCNMTAGFITIPVDGDRIYIDIDREAAGAVVVVPNLRTKADAALDRFYAHRVHFATRYGDVVYLYDGTRIEAGQSVALGSTPPPDGSVTYTKLADETTAFHTEVFRDYVSPSDWENDVIWRNTLPSAITYDDATGNLTYTDVSVDLTVVETAFNAGLPLTVILKNVAYPATTAYNRERIHAVDVANRRVQLFPGLDPIGALALGAGSLWNGAVVVGNAACTNDSLLGFTYTPTGVNPGRVTYDGVGLAFNDTQVVPGYLFNDNSGKQYVIEAVDAVGQYVDIKPGLIDPISAVFPLNKWAGAITTNNNPYKMKLADLKVSHGVEFIPIDTYGPVIKDLDTSLLPFRLSFVGTAIFTNRQAHHIIPYDPRVKVWRNALIRNANASDISDANNSLHYENQKIRIVEFTGVFTDIGLVVGDGASNVYSIVDGREYGLLTSVQGGSFNNSYGVANLQYQVITGQPVTRLTPGVHHVQFWFNSDVDVRGLVIVNNASRNSDATVYNSIPAFANPGTAVLSGNVTDIVSEDHRVLPAATYTGASWFKGSRVVDYLTRDGLRGSASTPIRGFGTTGAADAGTNLIDNVPDTSPFRIGDIILLLNSVTGEWDLRRITTVGGFSLLVDSNPSFTLAATTIHLYGSTCEGYLDRTNEDVAAHIPLLEFSLSHYLVSSSGMSLQPLATRDGLTPVGLRLTDGITLLTGSVSLANDGDSLHLTAADECVIGFVGTGLSAHLVSSAAGATIYVDGCDAGDLDNTDVPTDQFGYYLCGDLPYGYHTVRFVAVGDFKIYSFTAWQPKKPALPVRVCELLDTNLVALGVRSLSFVTPNLPTGVFDTQPGTIHAEGGTCCHFRSASMGDVSVTTYGTFANGRYYRFDRTAANEFIEWSFYGDEITLLLGTTLIGADVNVTVRDTSGDFVAPSAVGGFNVAGLDAIGGIAGLERSRWLFDRLGWYTLRLECATNGDAIVVDGVEIHTPFHSYKTKQPVSRDHFTPFPYSGRDVRNMLPVNANLINNTVTHTQGAILNAAVAVPWDEQKPFVFYSPGGMVKLHATAEMNRSLAADFTAALEVDGINDGEQITTTVPAAGDFTTVSLTRVIQLPQGLHYAFISGAAAGTTNVRACHWSVDYLSPSRCDQSLNRGQGFPMIGPVNAGESSF